MKLFCFGLGYSAAALALRLRVRDGITIAGTRTRVDGAEGPIQIAAYQGDARNAGVVTLLEGTTHVLISIPPDVEGCAALRHFGADLAALPSLEWIGYLSTIGVYGDHGGAWVDEDTPVKPSSERSLRRWQAEQAWSAFGRETGRCVQVFRLPGIYGPGRSVLDTLKAGTAKRLIKPGQVFNRIHVDDIAQALDVAMACPSSHALFNVTDDAPCAPEDVVTYGAALLGMEPPPALPFDASRLSPMAASFYAESKRVGNTRLKTALGVQLLYPTYREGLLAILNAR
jgi:nucleoside-diphosphate-sugar epimerase